MTHLERVVGTRCPGNTTNTTTWKGAGGEKEKTIISVCDEGTSKEPRRNLEKTSKKPRRNLEGTSKEPLEKQCGLTTGNNSTFELAPLEPTSRTWHTTLFCAGGKKEDVAVLAVLCSPWTPASPLHPPLAPLARACLNGLRCLSTICRDSRIPATQSHTRRGCPVPTNA